MSVFEPDDEIIARIDAAILRLELLIARQRERARVRGAVSAELLEVYEDSAQSLWNSRRILLRRRRPYPMDC